MRTLLRIFFAFMARIPLPVLNGLGAILGSLFALIPNRHRRITLRNLELCFPEMPERQRARLLILSLRETARTILETALVWRVSRQRLLRLVREVRGEALLLEAIESGRGVIFASPHLGNWELFGQYIQSRYSLTCMYKPAQNAIINELMLEGRTHLGMQLAPTDPYGIRILMEALKHGNLIGILPDQDPKGGAGVFAPFFGIPTKTMTLLQKLAAKSGAAVLVVYAERLSWGRGYRIHFLPVDDALYDKDEVRAATALNAGVETAIRENPAQYAWSYKRFRSRPEGETSLYR